MKKYIIISIQDYNKLEEIKKKYEHLIKQGATLDNYPGDTLGKKSKINKICNEVKEIVVNFCN